MSEHVRSSLEGGVLELRMDRPEKRNALTRPMYTALAEALETAAGDAAVRAVLICGSGDGFCAGNDLADFVSGAPPLGEDRHRGGFCGRSPAIRSRSWRRCRAMRWGSAPPCCCIAT